MKSVVIFLLLITASCLANDETTAVGENDYTDVILFKSGASVTGKITSNIPGKEITIVREDGQEFIVPFDEIFAVTDMEHLEDRRKELELYKPSKKQMKWENVSMIGFRNGDKTTRFSASVTNGILLDHTLYLGLGLGWDYYPEITYIPIIVSAKYYTDYGSTRPFVFGKIGYTIIEGDSGGITFGTGLGIRLAIDDGPMPLAQIGYRIQMYDREGVNSKNFMTAMIGIVF